MELVTEEVLGGFSDLQDNFKARRIVIISKNMVGIKNKGKT